MIDLFDYNLIEAMEGLAYINVKKSSVADYLENMLNCSILSDYISIFRQYKFCIRLKYDVDSIITTDIIESYLKIIIDRYKKLNEDYKQEYNNEEDLIHV